MAAGSTHFDGARKTAGYTVSGMSEPGNDDI